MRIVITLVAALAVTACGTGEDAEEYAALPACQGTDNLLANPDFGATGGQGLVPWQGSQHAGEPSFAVSAEQGELTIQRIGTQPYFVLEQFPSVDDLTGHDLLYHAELRLDLDGEDWVESMEPGGGLQVQVWGPVMPVLGTSRVVYRSVYEHEPHLGETDWFRVAIPFSVPADATRLSIGYQHRANGTLVTRRPTLLDCGPSGASPGTG